jgi:predicted glutamine amidotransferase
MCVIAIIDKKTKSKSLDIQSMLVDMAQSNPDGLGIITFNKNKHDLIKRVDSYDVLDFHNLVNDAELAVVHFRLATHGMINEENCHPFHLGNDIYLMHNGICSGLGNDNHSDTYSLRGLPSQLACLESKCNLMIDLDIVLHLFEAIKLVFHDSKHQQSVTESYS